MEIPPIFLLHATKILGNTHSGLTGSDIGTYMEIYANQFGIEIPYFSDPFPNKRTELLEILKLFNSSQQYKIIYELCGLGMFKSNKQVKELKIELISKFGSVYGKETSLSDVNESLIDETALWLKEYSDVLEKYQDAIEKYNNEIYDRNVLDDMRFSLEILLKKHVLNNNKSLENQKDELGKYLKRKALSPTFNNIFIKLVDLYSIYQNNNVKHNDNINKDEIEFIIELTSSFMKFLIKLK